MVLRRWFSALSFFLAGAAFTSVAVTGAAFPWRLVFAPWFSSVCLFADGRLASGSGHLAFCKTELGRLVVRARANVALTVFVLTWRALSTATIAAAAAATLACLAVLSTSFDRAFWSVVSAHLGAIT
jgi:hypothetical protein